MISADNKKTAANQPKEDSEFFAVTKELFSSLPERAQSILIKRFGLTEKGEAETLEKIGREYSITRERVRQIVSDAMKTVSKISGSENFKKMEDRIVFAIEKSGGIIKEEEAIQSLNSDGKKEENAIRFIAECSGRIEIVFEKGVVEKSWALSQAILKRAKEIGSLAENILKEEKNPLNDEKMAQKVMSAVSGISSDQALNFLKTLSRIRKNKFGKWGIYNWTEISPKGSREKIRLVLKEENRPLHFTEIAALIDNYGLSKKKSHPQTIHNELIKDDQFVLIGRGIYALREWGYYEGTIRDVIKNILKESETPLKKEDILERVFKIRKVKKTTVMINLNNSGVFEKKGEYYSLKK